MRYHISRSLLRRYVLHNGRTPSSASELALCCDSAAATTILRSPGPGALGRRSAPVAGRRGPLPASRPLEQCASGAASALRQLPGHYHALDLVGALGVVNAGGTEKPGRAIDGATFAGGSFRIDHSAGQPTVRFDPATCVGTITQGGPFEVIDATGDMGGLAGSGRYVFQALYTTARVAGHCSSTMTAYTETIQGVATVKA